MRHAELLQEAIHNSIKAKQAFLSNEQQLEAFNKAVEACLLAYRKGGRLYIAGNGGSAADAQHLAAELVCRLGRERGPLPAEALTVDTSIITAIANDYGYEEIFARQVSAKMQENDVFLAISLNRTLL